MKKMLLAFAAFSVFFLTNCKKDDDDDDDDNTPAVTVESLAGNYKLKALKVKLDLIADTIDVTNVQLEDCELDDLYNLKTDLTYVYTDAGTQCDPNGSDTGTWAVPGNNKIHLDGEIFDVAKWDGKELHVSQSGTDPTTGQTGKVILQLTRQ